MVFNGMVNGNQATFNGTAKETWLGTGKEQVEVLSSSITGSILGQSPVRTIQIVQTGPNAITFDGVPASIDGNLEAPCSGRTSYTITNSGKGSQTITQLPNTASVDVSSVEQLLFQPYVLAGALIGGGFVLVLLSTLLREKKS